MHMINWNSGLNWSSVEICTFYDGIGGFITLRMVSINSNSILILQFIKNIPALYLRKWYSNEFSSSSCARRRLLLSSFALLVFFFRSAIRSLIDFLPLGILVVSKVVYILTCCVSTRF